MSTSGPPAPSESTTFRDFAGALMAGDDERAAAVLELLLGLDNSSAQAATDHFRAGMNQGGQPFMMKAMGLRGAVQSGDEPEIRLLVADCFGLDGEALGGAVAALRERYSQG